MRIQARTVEEVGLAIRAMRKASGVRQDDVPGVIHMFLRDLERGKETVQFGRVLQVLQELGIHMVLEVPDGAEGHVQRELERSASKAALAKANVHGKSPE